MGLLRDVKKPCWSSTKEGDRESTVEGEEGEEEVQKVRAVRDP